MDTLKDRFLALSALHPEITQADLARATGAKPPSVNAWFTGETKSMKAVTAARAAAVYGVSAHWLSTGEGEMIPSITSSNARYSSERDRVEGMEAMNAVPLVSWVTAGCWADISDPYQPGVAEDDVWMPCPARHGPRTYCLRVRGESMFNPGGSPSYANGDVIFVDPDRQAKPGDRVVVRMDDQQEATFKQLVMEDGRMLLRALNPEWKPRYIEINGHATITGVVIGKWVPE